MTTYTWDQLKATTNQAKHGVTFEEALSSFLDVNLLYAGQWIVDNELREHHISLSATGLILFVGYTVIYDGEDDIIRIITAREATGRERNEYRSNFP